MEFVKARFFTSASRGVDEIERIVWHTIEIAEVGSAAENTARFFANLPLSTPVSHRVSSHYAIDNDSVVQCVLDKNVANHALGDNLQSLGFELAGRAGQSFAEWRDGYSKAVVENACQLAARKCLTYKIPPRWLTEAQVKARARGFETHKVVSDVFGEGIRSDPGAKFPYEKVVERVEEIMGTLGKVEFALLDGEGTQLAVSAPVKDEKAARVERLKEFTGNRAQMMDAELEADRDVVIRRRRAES